MSTHRSADLNVFRLDDFSGLDLAGLRETKSWQGRYKTLVRWGDRVQVKEAIRQPQNLVKGCDAKVWLVHQCVDGLHQFAVDGEGRIIKGLAALLMVQFNNRNGVEIISQDINQLLSELDLAKHLSPSRANGFKALLQRLLSFVEQSSSKH